MPQQNPRPAVTRDEAIAAAGRVLAEALHDLDTKDPHQLALAAHTPGGPSVAELEDRIRARRGLPPLQAAGTSHPGA